MIILQLVMFIWLAYRPSIDCAIIRIQLGFEVNFWRLSNLRYRACENLLVTLTSRYKFIPCTFSSTYWYSTFTFVTLSSFICTLCKSIIDDNIFFIISYYMIDTRMIVEVFRRSIIYFRAKMRKEKLKCSHNNAVVIKIISF